MDIPEHQWKSKMCRGGRNPAAMSSLMAKQVFTWEMFHGRLVQRSGQLAGQTREELLQKPRRTREPQKRHKIYKKPKRHKRHKRGAPCEKGDLGRGEPENLTRFHGSHGRLPRVVIEGRVPLGRHGVGKRKTKRKKRRRKGRCKREGKDKGVGRSWVSPSNGECTPQWAECI